MRTKETMMTDEELRQLANDVGALIAAATDTIYVQRDIVNMDPATQRELGPYSRYVSPAFSWKVNGKTHALAVKLQPFFGGTANEIAEEWIPWVRHHKARSEQQKASA